MMKIATLVVSLLVATTSFAATDPIVEKWTERMAEASDALKAQRYDEALSLSNQSIGEMLEMLGPGTAATQLFGIVITHKALAHAGLGQNDEALWYWHTVLSLYPKFAESDMSMYGEPGAFLEANLWHKASCPAREGRIDPPRVRKRVEPKYPHGAQAFAVSGALVVEVVITETGELMLPRIVKALPAPTLSYAALDAVRRWKFDPARIGGKPAPVIFQLTVNYKP